MPIHPQTHTRARARTCMRNMHQKLKRAFNIVVWLFIRKRSIFRIVYINGLFACLLAWFGCPGLAWPGLALPGMGQYNIHKRMICDNFLLCAMYCYKCTQLLWFWCASVCAYARRFVLCMGDGNIIQ